MLETTEFCTILHVINQASSSFFGHWGSCQESYMNYSGGASMVEPQYLGNQSIDMVESNINDIYLYNY